MFLFAVIFLLKCLKIILKLAANVNSLLLELKILISVVKLKFKVIFRNLEFLLLNCFFGGKRTILIKEGCNFPFMNSFEIKFEILLILLIFKIYLFPLVFYFNA